MTYQKMIVFPLFLSFFRALTALTSLYLYAIVGIYTMNIWNCIEPFQESKQQQPTTTNFHWPRTCVLSKVTGQEVGLHGFKISATSPNHVLGGHFVD